MRSASSVLAAAQPSPVRPVRILIPIGTKWSFARSVASRSASYFGHDLMSPSAHFEWPRRLLRLRAASRFCVNHARSCGAPRNARNRSVAPGLPPEHDLLLLSSIARSRDGERGSAGALCRPIPTIGYHGLTARTPVQCFFGLQNPRLLGVTLATASLGSDITILFPGSSSHPLNSHLNYAVERPKYRPRWWLPRIIIFVRRRHLAPRRYWRRLQELRRRGKELRRVYIRIRRLRKVRL